MTVTKAVFIVAFDAFESFGIFISWLFSGIYMQFRRLSFLPVFFQHLRFLMPRGLMAPWLRCRLDEVLGHDDHAVAIYSHLAGVLEDELMGEESIQPGGPLRGTGDRILARLYESQTAVLLRSGRIDEAMRVVIRAHHHLDLDNLQAWPELTARKAFIVRAGLAAGRSLESKFTDKKPGKRLKAARRTANSRSREDAKVIPFPLKT